MCVRIALQWVAFVTNKEIFLQRIHLYNETNKQTLYKTGVQLLNKIKRMSMSGQEKKLQIPGWCSWGHDNR